ncbi:MAG: polysaccharide biosynthesis/export family protein [Verrucomicrobiota bacterium]
MAFAIFFLLAVAAQAADLSSTNINAKPTAKAEVINTRHLQPNDMLQVSVYQQPDLTANVTVDDRGMVMLPLLGAVKLGGLTLEQATIQVQNLYDKDYLVDPKVTIQVGQMAVLRFTILGQVQRPGSYEFPPNEKLNLMEGIAMGGGFTRLAAPSKVTLQRNVNGVLKVYYLDADAMARDQQNNPFQLQPGDTITVGERIF